MAKYITPEGKAYDVPEEGEVFRIKDSPNAGIAIRSGNKILETNLEVLGQIFHPLSRRSATELPPQLRSAPLQVVLATVVHTTSRSKAAAPMA